SLARLRTVPHQFSWVDQRLVQERYIDHLSPEACALYLFLVTVADARGLSFYADRSLCERLSMTPAVLGQARQALVTCALVAYWLGQEHFRPRKPRQAPSKLDPFKPDIVRMLERYPYSAA